MHSIKRKFEMLFKSTSLESTFNNLLTLLIYFVKSRVSQVNIGNENKSFILNVFGLVSADKDALPMYTINDSNYLDYFSNYFVNFNYLPR